MKWYLLFAFMMALLVIDLADAAAGSMRARQLCISPEAEIARVATNYSDAVRHEMTAEQVANFGRSVEMPEIDQVMWFERDDFLRLYVVAFQHGCVIERGGMTPDELEAHMTGGS